MVLTYATVISPALYCCILGSGPFVTLGEGDSLSEDERGNVKEAIARGVEFLKRSQLRSGSWVPGMNVKGDEIAPQHLPVGFAALGGLTLLECGVPKRDHTIQRALAFVRTHGPACYRTYEVALAVLFLDKFGEVVDKNLLRTLTLRLAAGQSDLGGWGYVCPILSVPQEKKFLQFLAERKREDLPKIVAPKGGREPSAGADNSNTQFAVLALWVGRKYDVPLDWTIARIEQRFIASQTVGGWDYRIGTGPGAGAMTCVGILGLCVGQGAKPLPDKDGDKADSEPRDERIIAAIRALGVHMQDPTDQKGLGLGPKGLLNYYFLWSVERVGVFCGLQTIGGMDWYRWGVKLILPAQRPDGSWLGRGSMGFVAADTCFALLFLGRSDFSPGLRGELQKRLTITDPVLEGKGVTPKKGGSPKERKSPGEKKIGRTLTPREWDLHNGLATDNRLATFVGTLPSRSSWHPIHCYPWGVFWHGTCTIHY